MLNADHINEIHRLHHGEHWSVRKIARHLHLAHWGHFGALDYAGDKRKLYAFCLVEGHSRMLYI